MRVIKTSKSDTGHHVAGCQDLKVGRYHVARNSRGVNKAEAGKGMALMPVLSARGKQVSMRGRKEVKGKSMVGLQVTSESGSVTLLCARRKVKAEPRWEPGKGETAESTGKTTVSSLLNVWLTFLVVSEVNLQGHWVRQMHLLCYWVSKACEEDLGIRRAFWQGALVARSWSEPSELVLVPERDWRPHSDLPLGAALIWATIQSIDGDSMPRDRLRMGSRRGGIQGRAPPRDDHHSPSSSIEVTSQPRWFQDSNDEVGGQRESSPAEGDSRRELPILRYRLPCPHVNSSLIVTIEVEHDLEPQQQKQHNSRDESPIACLPMGGESGGVQPVLVPGMGWSVPYTAGERKLERPGLHMNPDAGPSVPVNLHPPDLSKGKQKMEDLDFNLDYVADSLVHAAPWPGPRELARNDSPHNIIQLSDSENTLHFGCRIKEQLQSTNEE